MTPQDFIAKWKPATLSERAACQEHFIDLCNMLGQPTRATADPDGTWFTFERHVQCVDGGKGFADVWKKGHFGWESKGKHKDLTAAYQQLLRYREDLENPPLMVVCDIDRFEIHSNFTNTAKKKYEFDLDGLSKPANLNTLRHLFTQPEALRPGQSPETVTQQVAEQFGQLADGMRSRGVDPQRAAHFLMKLMFCMFAKDIELLPDKVFHRIVQANIYEPSRLTSLLGTLFRAMADGADFGAERILRFNGGLFADADVVPLRADDINALVHVSRFDWGSVEPSIFGTLFERTLDPAKRSQIGAHYTSRDDILVLLEPVVMAPLRREWKHDNGFPAPRDPVLEPIESICLMDAIIDLADPDNPKEPEWPEADYIVGNPPFLGGKLLRANLGDAYVDAVFSAWDDRVPRSADLCCYWFEKARDMVENGRFRRAGLLATQGIRGGENRKVLERVKKTGGIFFAVSDRNWILDGAAVHVSMVGFDDGNETARVLDGTPVATINANLRATADITTARQLGKNLGISFMGDTKGGPFDVDEATACAMLSAPNPHGRPNSDVVVPWANGKDVTQRPRGMWILDFSPDLDAESAARYEMPFGYLEKHVRPAREKSRSTARVWWLHERPRPEMRGAFAALDRFVVTISLGKHRSFAWMVLRTPRNMLQSSWSSFHTRRTVKSSNFGRLLVRRTVNFRPGPSRRGGGMFAVIRDDVE